MTHEQTAQQLREELAKCRQGKGFNKYPAGLRQRAVAYCRTRQTMGVGPSGIAQELGVSLGTAGGWCRGEHAGAEPERGGHEGTGGGTQKLSLLPVVVRPQGSQPGVSRLEVDFVDGTRLVATGISAQELTATIELLRRRA